MIKRFVISISILILIVFFIVSYINIYSYHKQYTTIEKVPDKYKTIELSAAGDCTLGTGANFSYYGNFDWWFKEKAKGDFSYFFSGVKHLFEKDDFTFVNMEGTLTKSNNLVPKAFNFKGDPSYVNILLEGSVEGVNLANNHTNDYGQIGYMDTKKYLKEANVDYFGYQDILIKEIKGVKIAFVGYTKVGLWVTSDDEIIKSIKEIKNSGKADIIIANFHWGIELARKMNDSQIKLARLAIDNGADLVIGNHPHVVQGMELYKGKYIIYSLGNFVFGGNRYPGKGAWEAIITKIFLNYKNDELENIGIKLIPVSISSISTRNDYKPVVLEGKKKQNIIDIINQYSINYQYKEEEHEKNER